LFNAQPGFQVWDEGEEIGQVITLPAGLTGKDYRIYLGFDLTPEELEYNRANF
jgi:hypothetical protein